ncbi:MAG: hypothetical protein EZS28_049685, partial [Streblomastix strix]
MYESMRKAISSIIGLVTGKRLGQDYITQTVARGIRKIDLRQAKYKFIWEAQILRNYLQQFGYKTSLQEQSLQEKVVTLLLLEHSLRISELQKIEIGSVNVNREQNSISIKTRLKTSDILTTNTLDEDPNVSKIGALSDDHIRNLIKKFKKQAGLDVSLFSAYSFKAAGFSDAQRKGLKRGLPTRAPDFPLGNQGASAKPRRQRRMPPCQNGT